MRILSASAVHVGTIRCPLWNTHSIWPILLYMFLGDALLTMEPYRSTGKCIINCAPPEINVVVFVCFPQIRNIVFLKLDLSVCH